MRRLSNRVAVVTGAASGIGRATAVTFAKRGCALAVADLDEAGLAQTAQLVASTGAKVTQHRVDVSDKQRMEAFAGEVIEAHGRAHIIVNNAGVTTISGFERHSLEDFEWVMGVNFWGVVYGCKFFLPHLQREGWGSIVNISSLFGIVGMPGQTSYCSSKFAVRGFSESLGVELSNQNIDVLSVHPGGVRTNIVRSARGLDSGEEHARRIKWFERIGIEPEDAAERIVSAVERRRQRLLITKETYAIDAFKRLIPTMPRPLAKLARRRARLDG